MHVDLTPALSDYIGQAIDTGQLKGAREAVQQALEFGRYSALRRLVPPPSIVTIEPVV